MSRQLILLNDTLRVDDNPLLSIPKPGDDAIAVVIIPKAHFAKASLRRQQLLTALVEDFSQQLAELDIGLQCYIADPLTQLRTLIADYQIDEVVAAQPVAIDEVRVLTAVSQFCRVTLLDCNSLLDGELAPDLQRFPKSCSQFRSKREPELHISPISHQSITPQVFRAQTQLPFLPSQSEDAPDFTEYTSIGAKARWQQYLQSPAYSRYLETRNQLLGADYASFLSTGLASGTLSVRQCWNDIAKGPQHPSAAWLKQELFWREYFRHYFRVHGVACFQAEGLGKREPLPRHPRALDNFKRWCAGETGVPFIVANMGLLAQTGLMSNRGRQNVASYLVFELGVDWRLGAAYFEQQLLDYDVASNWGNWAYIAGAGEGPARHFNIMKQAVQYDADAAFVTALLPEINSHLHGRQRHQPYAINKHVPWQESWQQFLPEEPRRRK